MDAPCEVDLDDSKKSFSNRAAWISLLTPIVTFGVSFALFKPDWHLNSDFVGYYLFGAFCLQIISLILGIMSLFGMPQHGAKLILWEAAIGILASCGMGFLCLLGMALNGLGHNCGVMVMPDKSLQPTRGGAQGLSRNHGLFCIAVPARLSSSR